MAPRLLLALSILCLAAAPVLAEEAVGRADRDPRNPVAIRFAGQRLDLWSFQPLQRVSIPTVPEAAGNEIDALVITHLRKLGGASALAPEADRRALGRRLHFALAGLPPTPEWLEAFRLDSRPAALAARVDELLALPSYGEHLAALWMDAVRYSDTTGYDWDELRRETWRYRDWIVRAFNADMPYDQFLREQLAGDETFDGPPRDAAQREALLATGYLRAGPWDNSAKAFGEEGKTRAQWMSDLVETTGSAMLGLTFACCRCHDHKHDPLLQRDYYRMRAFFEPLEFRDDLPLDPPAELAAIREFNAPLEAAAAPFWRERQSLLEKGRVIVRGKKRKGPEEKVADGEAFRALSEEERKRADELAGRAMDAEKGRRKLTTALLASDGKPRPTHVLEGGDAALPREEVRAGIPVFFQPQAQEPSQTPRGTGRRTALAAWITSRDNPLTARVMVNRVWQWLYGVGMVGTPDDFGFAGARPESPELLDWLAQRFMEDGWSVKKLVRRIVLSQAWRQRAEAAPSFARQRIRRLSAEQLRDALLLTAGLLRSRWGGPPVWPTLPEEVLQANPAVLDDNETRTKGWYPSPAEEQDVRSLYLVRKRSLRVPFLETFDLPENFVSCSRRRVSTVAPQALTLMNSPLAVHVSRAFAERVLREAGPRPEAQLPRAWRLALGREASPDEAARLLPLWRERGAVEGCRVLLNLNEFAYVD